MKVKRLIIENVGKIKNTNIELDKPLILFYGEIKQGKTTILNAVKWVFGGSYPSDIIRHGEKEARVKLEFEGGSITREWYLSAKTGQVMDRPIAYVKDGEVVKSPVAEIKKYLNPYLLDNEFFKKMSETERKAYLPGLFGLDTSELDEKAATVEAEAKSLRATIKGYGEIIPVRVERINVEGIRVELQTIKSAHEKKVEDVRKNNLEAEKKHLEIVAFRQHLDGANREIERLEKALAEEKGARDRYQEWLDKNPELPMSPPPISPDTSELEEKISDAAAANVRAEQYEKDLARLKEKETKESELSKLEGSLKEIRAKKIAKLQEASGSCGIPGLVFDDKGGFIYDDTDAGMLSTSQIMKLSSELSALYPPGFGLELIDRGESLGKSIYEYIDRAQKEDKSILATIVGEKPATTPTNVGVFVVEDGDVK